MTAKPGTKSRWTIAETEQVKAMLDRGLSQLEIARAMATSQASISRLAAKIRESGHTVNASVQTWNVIVTDPAACLRQQPDMLTALIHIGAAYDAKVAGGPLGIDRPDWILILTQRGHVFAAYGAEKARREGL